MSQVKKYYYIHTVQMRSVVRPAEHYGRFRSERRLWFWRALAIVGAVGALLLLLFGGLLDWVSML